MSANASVKSVDELRAFSTYLKNLSQNLLFASFYLENKNHLSKGKLLF